MKTNGGCEHIFCGLCITRTWAEFYKKDELEHWRDVPLQRFRCPMCRCDCGGIPQLMDRRESNIPFGIDKAMSRMARWVLDRGLQGADLMKVEGMEDKEEFVELKERWDKEGEMSEYRVNRRK